MEHSMPVCNFIWDSTTNYKNRKQQPKKKWAHSVSFASTPPEITEKRARGSSKPRDELSDEESSDEDVRVKYVSDVTEMWQYSNICTRILLVPNVPKKNKIA